MVKKYTIDKNKFKFEYLPPYADWLLKNKLEEFVLIGIRFCRELDLPMLKPLSKLSEKELVAYSLESNKETLRALVNGTVPQLIEKNLVLWLENKMGIIDKNEIAAEDLTLAFYIRRKLFSYFLYGYTKSAPIQQLIINEVDAWSSFEEVITLKAFLDILKEAEQTKV